MASPTAFEFPDKGTHATESDDAISSPLEKLPTEVRVEIFALVLQADNTLLKSDALSKPKV